MLRSGPMKERNQPRKFYIPPVFNVVPNQLNLTVVPNFCYYHLLVRLVPVQLLGTWKYLFDMCIVMILRYMVIQVCPGDTLLLLRSLCTGADMHIRKKVFNVKHRDNIAIIMHTKVVPKSWLRIKRYKVTLNKTLNRGRLNRG